MVINLDKAWVEMMYGKIGKIGKLEVGYNRLAYSDADWQAKTLLIETMKDMGMTVRVDAVGNIIGRLEGTEAHAPVVAAGSHIDTVPDGGNYDGSVGVIGALCAVQRIKEKGKTKNPIEIWIFAGHESSRFGFAHLGSRSICGIADPVKWRNMKDVFGKTVPEVLASRNLDFEKIAEVKRDSAELKAFFELHIEQGPILEDGNLAIGIVTDIAAPIRLAIKINGDAAHSGTTPMSRRHDSLVTASQIVLAVRNHAKDFADKGIVGTVGMMQVKPGAMNIVPGYVEMWVDVRGIDFKEVSAVVEKIQQSAHEAAKEEGTKVDIDIISSAKPVHLDDQLMEQVKVSCEKIGVAYTYMIGGGGHDSQNIAQIMPTSVMHIPCRNGVSHTPEEFAKIEDIMAGVDVLTDVMERLAK